MAVFIACLVLFLAMTGHSSANYCLCKDGVADPQLQKNIDYACGNGADCSQILQNGPCYNPNTVKDHCNYAVNSYYQRKSQGPGTCDFSGTAVPQTQPPTSTSTCVYQSSPGNTGTPTSNNSSTSTPNGTNTNTPNILTPGAGTSSPGFGGISPGGNGIGISPDNNSNGLGTLHHNLLRSLVATILLSGLIICF